MLTFSYLFGRQRDNVRRERSGEDRGEEEDIDW